MVKLKSIVAGVAAAGLIASAPVAAVLAKSNNGNDNPGNKVTICHATGSSSNPYVVISPDANGVISGHVNHQDSRDIIPPFNYNSHGTTVHFGGQNWTSAGIAIYNNGCKPTTSGGGGQGGGGGVTPSGGQVLGLAGQGQSQFSQVPVGSANGGGGGISDFSLTSLARDW